MADEAHQPRGRPGSDDAPRLAEEHPSCFVVAHHQRVRARVVEPDPQRLDTARDLLDRRRDHE